MKAVEAMKVMKQELENVENVSWRSVFEEKHFFFLPRPSAVVLLRKYTLQKDGTVDRGDDVLHLFSEKAVD